MKDLTGDEAAARGEESYLVPDKEEEEEKDAAKVSTLQLRVAFPSPCWGCCSGARVGMELLSLSWAELVGSLPRWRGEQRAPHSSLSPRLLPPQEP